MALLGRRWRSMNDLITWIIALALVSALWGAAFWLAADTRDGRDWERSDSMRDE
jgi:hypothetical protein